MRAQFLGEALPRRSVGAAVSQQFVGGVEHQPVGAGETVVSVGESGNVFLGHTTFGGDLDVLTPEECGPAGMRDPQDRQFAQPHGQLTALQSGLREHAVRHAAPASLVQRIRASTSDPGLRRAELSERELDVLRLIANGKDNATIAGALHISPKTVKNHISNILMKLGIENRIQAAVYAVRSGLV